MSKKKRYNFTLDVDLMMWFKHYCKENRITSSAEINNQIFKLYKQNVFIHNQEILYLLNLTDELPSIFLISNRYRQSLSLFQCEILQM